MSRPPERSSPRDPRWAMWLGRQSWSVVGGIWFACAVMWLLASELVRHGLLRSVLMALPIGLAVVPVAAKLHHDARASQEALERRRGRDHH